MMDPARDPKTYTSRLELDYFRRPGRMRLSKWRVSLIALAVTGVVMAGLIAFPRWHTAFQAAPVSSAHSVFGVDCAACHDVHFTGVKRLVPGEHVGSVSDAKCLACHSAGRHDPHQTSYTGPDGQAAGCVNCHFEHRGAALLRRVADPACVACHADLQTDDKQHRYAANIRHFADGHPEFGLWRHKEQPTDPAGGKFFFNHQLHLKLADDWKDLPAHSRLTVADEVKKLAALDCNYCHRTDADEKRMLPIRYNDHCAKCHPLTAAPMPPDAWPEQVAKEFGGLKLPHPANGEGAEIVRAAVLERYLRFAERAKPPAKTTAVEPPVLRMPEDVGALIERERIAMVRTRMTEEQLFGRPQAGSKAETRTAKCALCHAEVSRSDGLPTYAWTYQQRGRWKDELATWPDAKRFQSPANADAANRWYPLAVFDHRSHRSYACTDCHAARTSSQTENVLIPQYANCVQCHRAGLPAARSDCLTCHRYHDRSMENPSPRTTPESLSRTLKNTPSR